MVWLGEEDFLRYADTIRQDGIDQAILTYKGFLKLTAVAEHIYTAPYVTDESNVVSISPAEQISPSVLEDRKLVINQLRNALRSGDSIAINKVVSHILTKD